MKYIMRVTRPTGFFKKANIQNPRDAMTKTLNVVDTLKARKSLFRHDSICLFARRSAVCFHLDPSTELPEPRVDL